ncbi:MAG: cytochrome o ubiquinol oxidase subunit III [Candidatus Doudnabacteria bacterium]|nr:cytochrome o ubiquinol oxidase subunit III [Candidatus Doudnabacteria bacterium]
MHPEHNSGKYIFGFWVYLMTDLIMFAALFAAFAALRISTFGGPTMKEIFDLPQIMIETLILLMSSFTCGLAMLAVFRGKKKLSFLWFGVTFILGLAFLILELSEFRHLINDGQSWTRSAFLSSYFALVGTHGLHIAVGLLWILVGLYQIKTRGLTPFISSKLVRFSLFWHFLDIVWIFIFTFVYLMGVAT